MPWFTRLLTRTHGTQGSLRLSGRTSDGGPATGVQFAAVEWYLIRSSACLVDLLGSWPAPSSCLALGDTVDECLAEIRDAVARCPCTSRASAGKEYCSREPVYNLDAIRIHPPLPECVRSAASCVGQAFCSRWFICYCAPPSGAAGEPAKREVGRTSS